VAVTTKSRKNDAITFTPMNFSGDVGHVTIIFSRMLTSASCSLVRLGLWLESGLDLVYDWLVVYAHAFILIFSVTFPLP